MKCAWKEQFEHTKWWWKHFFELIFLEFTLCSQTTKIYWFYRCHIFPWKKVWKASLFLTKCVKAMAWKEKKSKSYKSGASTLYLNVIIFFLLILTSKHFPFPVLKDSFVSKQIISTVPIIFLTRTKFADNCQILQ